MHAILIKGVSQYGVLRLFIDELAEAFGRAGVRPVVIDAQEPGALAAALGDRALHGARLVFTFNILGEALHLGRPIGAVFGAPHVIQYVDHPLAHTEKLDGTTADAGLLFVDETHAAAVERAYGPGRFAHLGFCPHAAIGEARARDPDPQAFFERRPIPILFSGSILDPGPRPWAEFDEIVRHIHDAAFDIAMGEEWLPAHDAFAIAMGGVGLDPADPRWRLLHKGAGLVHQHVRMHRRLMVLEAAARLGLPIHACGRGYEPWLDGFGNITHLGALDVTQSIAIMARSRVLLNVNANFGGGSHERALTAMRAGAAVASDASSYYRSQFKLGTEMVFYRWSQLDSDLERIAALAENPEAAFALARAGQAVAVKQHGWDNRVPVILNAADQVRAGVADRS
jgi:hypothetical protein